MTKRSCALRRPIIGFRLTFLRCMYRYAASTAVLAGVVIGGDVAQAANLTWNGVNADWTVGTNWTPGGPPGAGDVAIINAGNPQLNANTTLLGLVQSGGTVSGTGALTLTGASTWNAGTHSGAGTTQFDNTLAMIGVGGKGVAGRKLNLNGTTTWSGNTGNNNLITLSGAGVLNNAGAFTDANAFNSSINAGGGGGTFNNSGTFTKQSNTTTALGVAFNNTGTLNVNAGLFLPSAGGISTGLFNIATGAKLEFRNGNHTLNNVTTSGLGTLQISTENVGADAFVAINGGTHTSAFVLSGSTLGGTDHTFQGNSSWTGGGITGAAATTFGGTLAITGANSKAIGGGRTINAGNTTWSGSTGANNTISLANASVFNNTGVFADANTFDSSIVAGGGGGGTFNNSGLFTKQSNTTTALGVVFNNTGTLNVNAGTLLMGGGGTNTGVFNIADGAKLEYRNGKHTLNNVTTSGLGTLQISTENVGADATVAINGGTHSTAVLFSGSRLTGSDQIFQGAVTWTGGALSGAASTTFNNAVTTISGANTKVIGGGRVLNLTGTTTWTGNTANNNNAIQFAGGGTLNNNGTFNDANAFDSFVEHSVGGPHNFNSLGVYNKQSNTITTFDIGIAFNNTGTVNLNAGILRPAGGTSTGLFNIASGATLEFRNGDSTLNNVTTSGAGTFLISTDNVGADAAVTVNGGTHTTAFVLSGSGLTGTNHTFQGLATWSGGAITGASSTTFSNDVAITGALTKVVAAGRVVNLNRTTTWSGNTAINNNAIQFSSGAVINNNGTFNDENAFASFIEHSVAGGTFNNNGTYNKRANTVTTADLGLVFNNAGTVNINAGTMRFFGGVQGPNGTVRVASGATFQQDFNSAVGNLITAGNLVLSNRTVTVHADYDNANFGVGNAFNARANVTGTGLISASGTPSLTQLIAAVGAPPGSGVTGGNTATATLTIGNVHVGNNTIAYQLANNNVGGPALRGAIQTAVGGANITDGRLSGSGVTAANFGPIAAGSSNSFNVNFNAGAAGALTPLLTGQIVRIANNFDNVAEQNLNIVLGTGAAAYNLASADLVTPNPVTLVNQRVGGNARATLTITNGALAGSFTEALDAGFGATTGAVLSNGGSVNLLTGGASDNSSLTVRDLLLYW